MNKRLDLYVNAKYIGTFMSAETAVNALYDEIEIDCDNVGGDYPSINEELMVQDFEIVLEDGGEEHFYIDNTVIGVDTGTFCDWHIDIVGGIDMF